MQGNPQQALDILQTGLTHQTGVWQNRLHLAIAEVQATDYNWVGVQCALPVLQTPVTCRHTNSYAL